MTKTFLICTFVLLVTQYALSGTSDKADPTAIGTEVKSEEKKEIAEVDKNKPLVVAEEEKSKDEDYKAQIETGTKIQGDGPFVVNAEQLPQDAVRDEEQAEQEMAMDDLIQEQTIQSEAEENNSKPTLTAPAAVASRLNNKNQTSGSQVGGLLGSSIGGAVGGYPGHYPGGSYGSYGGYPQNGDGYSQYGGQYGGGHYGGYPGGGHHHHHHHGYGYRTTVQQPDKRSHPCPHGRHQCPNGIVVSREQLASDPSLAAHVVPLGTGSMPGYHFAQQPVRSFNSQPKPQQPSAKPFNLPAL